MFLHNIILFAIVVSFFVCDACQSSTSGEKHKTTSRTFQKLRTNATAQCQYINRDFAKLAGHWFYVLRTVTPKSTPPIRCGQLSFTEITTNGFRSELIYVTHEEEVNKLIINGIFVNETVVEIPQLDTLLTGNPELKYPFNVQMGICDDNSVLFIEPIHYLGGGMLFTREIPEDTNVLKVRFGTYDEKRGKEQVDRVSLNCTLQRYM